MRKLAAVPCAKHSKRVCAYLPIKRILDIVISSLMIAALSPLLLLLTLITAVDTHGSPIFVQERMGRYSVPFRIYKFRTMSVNAPSDVATHKLEHAERYISRVGGFLRRASLDELPQLFNVLKGDMSFVGPRPVVLTERDLIRRRRRGGADRVRPGITGLAQVSGRDTVTIREKARLDADYARHPSLLGDLRIVVMTAAQVLVSDGIVEGANAAITEEVRTA